MKIPIVLGVLSLAFGVPSPGAVTLSQSSTLFNVIGGRFDYVTDQQTGIPAGDIVGDADTNFGFFTAFDNNGTLGSKTDGHLAFRVRLDGYDGNSNNPSFQRTVWVGIDADISGSIDVFVGMVGYGNNHHVAIHAPSAGANTSPDTTGVASTPYAIYPLNSYPEYMDYRAVNEDDYVGFDLFDGDSLDLGNNGVDYYISFQLPFGDLVNFLSSTQYNPGNTMTINDESALRFMVATATQDNIFNQDVGGVPADYDSSMSWADLGTFTPPVNAQGEQIPEPTSRMLSMLGLAAMLVRRRR